MTKNNSYLYDKKFRRYYKLIKFRIKHESKAYGNLCILSIQTFYNRYVYNFSNYNYNQILQEIYGLNIVSGWNADSLILYIEEVFLSIEINKMVPHGIQNSFYVMLFIYFLLSKQFYVEYIM